MPTPRPSIVASVGAVPGTSATCSSKVITLSAVASPAIAVMIGRPMATIVPNVSSSTMTAIVRPTSSLDSVLGFDSFWPRYPPASTSRPAFRAGSASAKSSCARSTDRSLGESRSESEMYPVSALLPRNGCALR